MVKGLNRRVIEIKNPDGEYFEKALFFVRPEKSAAPQCELTKSLNGCLTQDKEAKRSLILNFALVVVAAALGAGICAAFMLLA